jgi:hypothetical protein
VDLLIVHIFDTIEMVLKFKIKIQFLIVTSNGKQLVLYIYLVSFNLSADLFVLVICFDRFHWIFNIDDHIIYK